MVDRVQLFGITFDRVRMAEATTRIANWCAEPTSSSHEPCRLVVTPNVDHAVLFQEREALRAAYASAAMVLVDGAPIVWASRLLRRPLPERVAGSDLVPALFDAVSRTTHWALAQFAAGTIASMVAEQIVPFPSASFDSKVRRTDCQSVPDLRSLKVFLLGAAPGVAERAARRIADQWPQVSVVGIDSPPLGFENNSAENERILRRIADAAPDLVIVGLGAPKQELWTHTHLARIHAKVAICAGATIDFLAGEKRRSPRWMRRVGLEWLHRVASEPRRLVRRYAHDAIVFPQLVWREWRTARPA